MNKIELTKYEYEELLENAEIGRIITDWLKRPKNTKTKFDEMILIAIENSIAEFKKAHPKWSLEDRVAWKSIAKRIKGQIFTCFHNERYNKK